MPAPWNPDQPPQEPEPDATADRAARSIAIDLVQRYGAYKPEALPIRFEILLAQLDAIEQGGPPPSGT